MSRLQVVAFLLVALLDTSHALAQSSQKTWRLGVLTTGSAGRAFESFRSQTFPQLAKQGFVEGKNLVVDFALAHKNSFRDLHASSSALVPMQ